MDNQGLENRIKILEQKLELKELDEELQKKKKGSKSFFSPENAPFIIAIIGGVISLIVVYIQKNGEVNLERQKFANTLIEKVVDRDSANQQKIKEDLFFYSKLGLLDISKITRDTVIGGKDTSVITIQVPTSTANQGGVERWDIKVLNDSDALKINYNPVPSTIQYLSGLKVNFNSHAPRMPEELQVYQIDCKITAFGMEVSGDCKLVLSDNQGNTMVGKIPDPDNSQIIQSGRSKEYAAARQVIVNTLGPIRFSIRQVSNPINVTVTGVGFVNRLHHATGESKNGFEIHPVLKIELR